MNLDLLPGVLAGSVVLAGLYLLVGLSWVIVFRASQLMNFSTGQFLVLAGFICATLVGAGWNYWAALVTVIAGMAVLGILLYRFILRPLSGQDLFAPVVATLGVAIVVQGVIQIIWGPQTLAIAAPFPNTPIKFPLGISLTVNDLILPAIALIFWISLMLFLRFTKFGGQMRAANESTLLASQSGMNVYLIFAVAFAISFAALALAGIANSQRSLVALSAIPLGLKGLVPAMLGGLNSVGGVALGAIIVAVCESLAVLFFGGDWSNLVVFVILLIVLAIKPHGIFGRAEAQRV